MTIEIALLISVVSVVFGVYSAVQNQIRAKRKDDKNDASQQSAVMMKLEFMSAGIIKLETKLDNVDSGNHALREGQIIFEHKTNARIDALENKMKEIENK